MRKLVFVVTQAVNMLLLVAAIAAVIYGWRTASSVLLPLVLANATLGIGFDVYSEFKEAAKRRPSSAEILASMVLSLSEETKNDFLRDLVQQNPAMFQALVEVMHELRAQVGGKLAPEKEGSDA